MKILIHSETTAATIKTNLGLPEYSYYFVLKEFLPALRELGDVIIVGRPELEVDQLYAQCQAAGEACVFLSFTPPNKTPLTLNCPTIPVFAWEFDSLPDEAWLDDRRQDWGYVLSRLGYAITHSVFTVATAHRILGMQYPIISVPAPVWDHFEDIRNTAQWNPAVVHSLGIDDGVLLDSCTLRLSDYLHVDPDEVHAQTYGRFGQPAIALEPSEPEPESESESEIAPQILPRPGVLAWTRISLRYLVEWFRLVLCNRVVAAGAPTATLSADPAEVKVYPTEVNMDPVLVPRSHRTELQGVVFTSVFNPYDGRKNWQDLLTAFCTALRDKPDATLVFKLTNREYHSAVISMLKWMAQLPEFRCRVLLVQGYLGDEDYKALVHATSFVVNASYGEGQCLPLMEFLSCGKPAIAPRHSGMVDYIDEQLAFVVDSWLDSSAWPHDPRLACRTRRQMVSWESLASAYSEAYRVFKDDSGRYRTMSELAIARMRAHCSRASAVAKLRPFLAAASRFV